MKSAARDALRSLWHMQGWARKLCLYCVGPQSHQREAALGIAIEAERRHCLLVEERRVLASLKAIFLIPKEDRARWKRGMR